MIGENRMLGTYNIFGRGGCRYHQFFSPCAPFAQTIGGTLFLMEVNIGLDV